MSLIPGDPNIWPEDGIAHSGESLLYNRDTNFSGISTIDIKTDVTPSYGSTVSFSAKNHSYKTDNNYYNLIPLSANSLTAKFEPKYDVEESRAAELANFFESKNGVEQFEFKMDSEIYQEVSGVSVNYAINHLNRQHYEVAASIDVLEAPNLFNWADGNFVNAPLQVWLPAASYKKYDVVYSRFNSDVTTNEVKLNNFYYCTGDHTSSESNSPTGLAPFWTQKFFFEPDQGFQNDVRLDVQEISFKNSHKLRVKTRDNIATFPVKYKFSNITSRQLKSMLHFLENKGGYRRFEHQIPSVYNRPKVYYCPEWSHTFKYYDSHDLDVSFVEDPMGVIPRKTLTNPYWNTSAEAYVTKVEGLSYYTFTNSQKVAISDFFDALSRKNLSSKVVKMWLVGFSVNAGRVDLISPDEVEAWTTAGFSDPAGVGFATFDDDAKMVLNVTDRKRMSDLGITIDNCGAFFAGTNMNQQTSSYVNCVQTSSRDIRLEQENDAGFRTRFRGANSYVKSTANKQDGVFVGSRTGLLVNMTRIKAGREAETATTVENSLAGATPNDSTDIILWGNSSAANTKGSVSTVGLTLGLSKAETKTLGEAVYDLCVGVGHTDLTTQDS